jgi:hypothetical protein
MARSTYATWREDPYEARGGDADGDNFPVGNGDDFFEDDIDEPH